MGGLLRTFLKMRWTASSARTRSSIGSLALAGSWAPAGSSPLHASSSTAVPRQDEHHLTSRHSPRALPAYSASSSQQVPNRRALRRPLRPARSPPLARLLEGRRRADHRRRPQRRRLPHRARRRSRPLHDHRQRAPLRPLLLRRSPPPLLLDGALMGGTFIELLFGTRSPGWSSSRRSPRCRCSSWDAPARRSSATRSSSRSSSSVLIAAFVPRAGPRRACGSPIPCSTGSGCRSSASSTTSDGRHLHAARPAHWSAAPDRPARLLEGDRTALEGFAARSSCSPPACSARSSPLDLFLFYVFWEVMLIPMYLVIGIWGGERRIYAAIKFFLFTMAGSLLMLLAILWMAWTHALLAGVWSFALRRPDAARPAARASSSGSSAPSRWPSRSRCRCSRSTPGCPTPRRGADRRLGDPRRHPAQARHLRLPALRSALLPPRGDELAPWLVGLSMIGIIYGALVAWVQPDMKKLVAYSSIAHLGFVMLGMLASTSWPGRARCCRWSTTASRPAPSSSSSACSTTAGTPRNSPTSAAWPR
jgi:hypothetical protein